MKSMPVSVLNDYEWNEKAFTLPKYLSNKCFFNSQSVFKLLIRLLEIPKFLIHLVMNDDVIGINIYPYPIYGMYQPDAIRTVTIGGREYIVTADEGDSKDYSGLKLTTSGFDETKRVRDITLASTYLSNNNWRIPLDINTKGNN